MRMPARIAVALAIALATALPAAADTLNRHDPNGNATPAAYTESTCSGFLFIFTGTITYVIRNEAMENNYTIDWSLPPFKVTNVPPGATRRTSIDCKKSCDSANGSVDWIDTPDAAAPSRGTQTFPAPGDVCDWVLVDILGELLGAAEPPSYDSLRVGGRLYDAREQLLASFTSRAFPAAGGGGVGLTPGGRIARERVETLLTQPWAYRQAFTNHHPQAVEFSVEIVDPPQLLLSGLAQPGETVQIPFEGPAPCGIGPAVVRIPTTGEVFPATAFVASGCPTGLGTCVGDRETLCLLRNRFRVDVAWRTRQGTQGRGQAVPLTDRSGALYFFNPQNLEILVKMVDACSFNDRFWVFLAATTNVEYTLTVTDTLADQSRVYSNALGDPAQPVLDTGAFATCP